MMISNEQLIAHTKKWIQDVVIACNFCPFAVKEVKQGTVRYVVIEQNTTKVVLQHFLEECKLLDTDNTIETTLLILPNGFEKFTHYLKLVAKADSLLSDNDYEGIYQVASFHPDYRFEGATKDDGPTLPISRLTLCYTYCAKRV